jgi:hypothetical protein
VKTTEHFGTGLPRTNGDEDNVGQLYGTGSGFGVSESNGIPFGSGETNGTGSGKGKRWEHTNGSTPFLGEGWGRPKKGHKL